MKKVLIIPASGLGDSLIFQFFAHQLYLNHYDVTIKSHFLNNFGIWKPSFKIIPPSSLIDDLLPTYDFIFLQHDNGALAKKIKHSNKPVYTFYGSYKESKHGPFRKPFDFKCDLRKSMVDNVKEALGALFQIEATDENGLKPPPELTHRKYAKKVVIHTTSGDPFRNWPMEKFQKVAHWLQAQGFEPHFLGEFPSLEGLTSFIYGSGYFIGNDSGPGHLASLLKVPHLIIGRDYNHMLHWRPGWLQGEIVTPPRWATSLKALRPYWKNFIPAKKVINSFKNKVMCN